MTFTEACQAVIAAASRSQGGNLQFAAAYARAGLKLTGPQPAGSNPTREAQIQAAYILANLRGWQGEEARKVKKFLRAYTA